MHSPGSEGARDDLDHIVACSGPSLVDDWKRRNRRARRACDLDVEKTIKLFATAKIGPALLLRFGETSRRGQISRFQHHQMAGGDVRHHLGIIELGQPPAVWI